MGNKKGNKVHVQGWLNPDVALDANAIQARKYFKDKQWTDRQIISTSFSMLMEFDETGTVTVEKQSSEMEMLKRILGNMSKLMELMSKMKTGYVVTETDHESIAETQRQIADETLSYMVSAPTEFDIEDEG